LYFLQIFSSFEKPLVQGVSSKVYSVIVSCVKIGAGKAKLYLREHMNSACTFHMYGPTWVEFSIRDLQIMLKMICELRVNRHREGRTFLVGVNEITH
jgi:hypothetical protein